ncbi:uncharacterized protein LOC129597285 [Paramacrobiotus metropolitanus]|uniref:uncharacterized protein LOC129597285 n=1 Tax=Paramacrobiotus metropolitanus TaxID=2943436 RepID=UPI002445E6E8|nr:uncharacterized protein LOC129597285 [Paramacrobiotus metropolitanus]XP_055350742.1 uncharacterized protein LOC129597285 [Paramacrobiotus metropolitanus]
MSDIHTIKVSIRKPAGVLLVLSAVEIALGIVAIPANVYNLLFGWLNTPGHYPILQLVLLTFSLALSAWLLVVGASGLVYSGRLRALRPGFKIGSLSNNLIILILVHALYLALLFIFWYFMLAERIHAKQLLRTMHAVTATFYVLEADVSGSLNMGALLLLMIATIVVMVVARCYCGTILSAFDDILRCEREQQQIKLINAPPLYSAVPQEPAEDKV